MAFEQGVASSQEDFADKLRTFADANGWTVNEWNPTDDRMSLVNDNISTLHFHWGWDNSNDIEVHQSLGWSVAGAPDSHTNDSGNGGLTSADRALNDIGNGPFVSYHFFAGTSPAEYLYAVLEYATGQFRHFAACQIDKIGNWTGGETVGASTWLQTSGVANNASSNNHCVLMDGASNSQTRSGTMHIEGLPNQPASGKWGIFAYSTTPGNDGDGNGRSNLIGGMRGGPYTFSLGGIPTSQTQGFVPLILVPCFYNDTGQTPDEIQLLGYYPNIRVINMTAFQPGDELTVGSDTWKIFPMIRRQETGGSTEEISGFGGIAYLKA